LPTARQIADYAFTFLFYYLASLTLHEYIHYMTGTLLGYTAEAHFEWLTGYVLFIEPVSLFDIWIIGIAGGLITGLLLLGISFFTEDWETDMILYFFIPLQKIYAFFQGLYLLGKLPVVIVGTVPVILAALVWLVIWSIR